MEEEDGSLKQVLKLYSSFLLVPILDLRFLLYFFRFLSFTTSIGEMTVFMTYHTFEGDLLVVQLLNVDPVVHLDFERFREALS